MSVPLAPIEQLFMKKNTVLVGAHLTFWLLGIAGILWGNTLVAGRVVERERAYAALAENEQRTRAIVSSSLDAIITIDEAGNITGWNRKAETIFGWSAREVMGIPLTSTIIPERYRSAHALGVERPGKMVKGRCLIALSR